MARAMSGTRRRTGWPGRLAALGLAGCLLVVQAAQAAESVTYFHFDALGSPVAATDEAGNVLWREAYRPYGERLRDEAGADQDLWYTGKPEEAEFGLQYFGARWYDPRTGRFQGLDPTGFVEDNIHSFNRYAYAVNNPYKFRDPDGRYIETAFDAVSLGLSFSAFVNEPSWGNFAALAYDGAATVVPFVPGGAGAVRTGAAGAETILDKSGDAAKCVPNRYGSRGGPAHTSTIERRIDELKRQGHEHLAGGKRKEELIPTPGGCKSCPRPDITTRSPDGTIYRENVGRSTRNGDPVARERRALDDIGNATGQRPGYTSYDQ